MFELVFAWTIFTLVVGKSAEAVTHAWKGTAPPGHQRRMARIRAREAAGARRGIEPPSGFGRWARTVWADSWNEATERHSERWPAKAAKKRERARARWAWWDHVEDEAGQRWDKRRTARDRDDDAPAEEPETDPDPESGPAPAERRGGLRYMAWETPERYGRLMTWEELTPAERELWRMENEDDPGSLHDDATRRGRLRGERDRVRLAHKRQSSPPMAPTGASPTPPDTPDSAPKTPGQGADGGVRGTRTPGQGPVSGGGATIPTTQGDDMPGEVMNLSGATKFTRALDKSYSASSERLEEVLAWLHGQNITSGRLHDRFAAILAATSDTLALIEKAKHSCEEQLRVRDAIEAAGGDALSKDALLKS